LHLQAWNTCLPTLQLFAMQGTHPGPLWGVLSILLQSIRRARLLSLFLVALRMGAQPRNFNESSRRSLLILLFFSPLALQAWNTCQPTLLLFAMQGTHLGPLWGVLTQSNSSTNTTCSAPIPLSRRVTDGGSAQFANLLASWRFPPLLGFLPIFTKGQQ